MSPLHGFRLGDNRDLRFKPEAITCRRCRDFSEIIASPSYLITRYQQSIDLVINTTTQNDIAFLLQLIRSSNAVEFDGMLAVFFADQLTASGVDIAAQ